MMIKTQSVSFLLLPLSLYAQTGYDIAKQMHEKPKPTDMQADLTMVLTNAKGQTRTSTLRTVSQDGGKRQMIWFLAPPDDKGVAFLKIEHEEGDDEMRLWLPAFNKVRRISSSKRGESFMGSDLSYEDLLNPELDDYTYQLKGNELIEAVECYILEIVPRGERGSSYNKHISWITKQDLTQIKEESYDRFDQLLKKKTFRHQRIKQYQTPKEIFVENVQSGHTTQLIFENVELDTGVEDGLFQEKNLKRPPR